MCQKGLWYQLYDFSDRDYGSNWGYILYHNGKEVERGAGFSSLRTAGDMARNSKKRWQEKLKKENK